MNTNKLDFKILDGLRGIAALYVVFNHARLDLFIGVSKYAAIENPMTWDLIDKIYLAALQLTTLGREFVILFFILSGFSIAFSLSMIPEIKSFYLRRIVRIYPPYLIALTWAFIIFVVLQKFIPDALPSGGVSVFSTLNFTINNIFYNNNGSLIPQFWSLKYEVVFYLLVPIFILKKNWYYILSILIAIVSFFISWSSLSGESILGRYFLDYNIFFAIGVYSFFNRQQISPVIIFKNRYLFFALSIIFFLGMVIFRHWIKFELNKISLVLAAIFAVTLLFNFLHYNIKNKLLMFLGNISYSVYITHFASITLLKGILLKSGVINSPEIQNKYLWVLGIPFAITIGYLFYLLIEKPSKEYLVKIRKRDGLIISK